MIYSVNIEDDGADIYLVYVIHQRSEITYREKSIFLWCN